MLNTVYLTWFTDELVLSRLPFPAWQCDPQIWVAVNQTLLPQCWSSSYLQLYLVLIASTNFARSSLFFWVYLCTGGVHFPMDQIYQAVFSLHDALRNSHLKTQTGSTTLSCTESIPSAVTKWGFSFSTKVMVVLSSAQKTGSPLVEEIFVGSLLLSPDQRSLVFPLLCTCRPS